MIRRFKKAYTYLLLFLSILLALSFLQSLHPFFDSIAHFRLYIVAACIFFSIAGVVFRQYLVINGVLLVLLFSYSLFLYFPLTSFAKNDAQLEQSISILQFNLLHKNKNLDKFLQYMRRSPVDVAMFQEVAFKNKKVLKKLAKQYPYQRYCKYTAVDDVVILSKYPLANIECLKGLGLITANVNINGKSIHITSVHLQWPFPFGQHEQITKIKNARNEAWGFINTDLQIVAGDFNAAPWSHSVKRFEELTNTENITGIQWSFFMPVFKKLGLWLPIDQVLVSQHFRLEKVEVLTSMGSDHFPLFVKLHF